MRRPYAFFIAVIASVVVVIGGCDDDDPVEDAVSSPTTAAVIEIGEIATTIPSDFQVPVWSPGEVGAVVRSDDPPPDRCTLAFDVPTDVAFAKRSDVISKNVSQNIVEFVVATVGGNPGRTLVGIDAVGYASVEGAIDFNQDLSERRAAAVVAVLRSIDGVAGVAGVVGDPVGLGETDRFGPGDHEEALSKNRKVIVSLRFAGCP